MSTDKKCVWLAHASTPYWWHKYPQSHTMGAHKIGAMCYCGKTKWTKAMQEDADAAWDRLTSDSNLNRM